MEKRIAVLLMALALCLSLCAGLAEKGGAESKGKKYVALLEISGELMADDYTYDHAGTLDAIDLLMDDPHNVGLLVLFNTPGGGIYEGDELYHELMVYKQKTGRPVYAYMEQECCSAGVYAAMAADYIMADKMTLTGSVGVYMQSSSEAGFYSLLGVENEYIATGENKVDGYPTLTEEQRGILQAIVDEAFMFFKEAIAEGRGMTEEQMAPFLDGRLLTALQAKEYGLIDEVCYYLDAIESFYECENLGNAELMDVTPENKGADGAESSGSILQWLMQQDLTGGARRNGVRIMGK